MDQVVGFLIMFLGITHFACAFLGRKRVSRHFVRNEQMSDESMIPFKEAELSSHIRGSAYAFTLPRPQMKRMLLSLQLRA